MNRVALNILALGFALAFESVYAKEEVREPIWMWCIFPCGRGGDYDSPQAALDARNAYIDEAYERCVANVPHCGSCSKSNKYAPLRPSTAGAIINGVQNFFGTSIHISTTYSAACASKPAEERSIRSSDYHSIGVYGKIHCPENDSWSQRIKNIKKVIIDGSEVPSYDYECVRNIPDPNYCGASFGNPVDAIGGQKMERALDYADTQDQLQVVWQYSSAGGGRTVFSDSVQRIIDYSRPLEMTPDGFLGLVTYTPAGNYMEETKPYIKGWFPFRLVDNDRPEDTIDLARADGGRIRYMRSTSASDIFVSQAPKKSSLAWQANQAGDRIYMAILPDDGMRLYDNHGLLSLHSTPDGRRTEYRRENGRLTVTSVNSGRRIEYLMDDATGRVNSVHLPDGRAIGYQYSQAGQVEKVTYQDGTQRGYLYSEPGLVAYPDKNPTWLTGIIDEAGNRLSTFEYDSSGPVRTERAGGAGRYLFHQSGSGTSAAATSGFTRVTLPDGVSQIRVDWVRGPDGERRVTARSQPAGAGCAASTSRIAYDSAGNRRSVNDFNGNRICYQNDVTRGFEIARVEGLPGNSNCEDFDAQGSTLPAGSRKISTQWHPVWQRATKVAEPLRMTTNIYNGQPDPFNGNAVASCAPADAILPDGSPIAVLCKKVEQATLDSNGAQGFAAQLDSSVSARVWHYTYNQWGQLLSETDPANATTTYSYYASTNTNYTRGDLQSIVDPEGKSTLFTRYDPNGRVLSQTSPNGVVTQNTYDARGRLLTQSVGDMVTVMTYLPTGLLHTLTQPNGYRITYAYDGAHRLTGWSDNRGHSGIYTLDAAGNRTSEQTKDAAGQLAYKAHYTIDALNRVASVNSGNAQTQSFQYDANGNLTFSANGLNQSAVYSYDRLGRMVSEKNPLNATATLDYNSLNAVVQARDFKGVTTRYERDAQGNALSETSADIGSQSNQYDARGLPASTQDAQQRQQHITRDALGRPTHISASGEGASASSSFSYDSHDSIGQIHEPNLHTGYQRDNLGRPTRKSQQIGPTP